MSQRYIHINLRFLLLFMFCYLADITSQELIHQKLCLSGYDPKGNVPAHSGTSTNLPHDFFQS